MTDNLLEFSAVLDRDQFRAGQPAWDLSCQIKIKPNLTQGTREKATTASICLAFDCSLSMKGRNFKTAIETAKMIVDILHERHWISLVAFQSESHIVFQNEVPTTDQKDSIKQQIGRLDSHLGGSTNLTAGIESAMDVLSESAADANVIVILSDGVPDNPITAQAAASVASQKGIQIYAVGIGRSYDADQLLRLVTPSNGAVFGNSEVDKISDIFYDIINRIDRIFVTNVIVNLSFHEHVQLRKVIKTSPERALLDSAVIDNDCNLELRVGNIEEDKVYEFLLQMDVSSQDAGVMELIRAKPQYNTQRLGINAQEIVLTINFTENDTLEREKNKKLESAIESATMMQLSDDLLQACSKFDIDGALQAIDKLQQRYTEENNTEITQHLEKMKRRLESGQRISDQDRNDFLLSSTNAKAEAIPESTPDASPEASPQSESFDLILIHPGSETIRLLREIRNATDMGLREITGIIHNTNSLVTTFESNDSAEKLKQRLEKIGAKVTVQPR